MFAILFSGIILFIWVFVGIIILKCLIIIIGFLMDTWKILTTPSNKKKDNFKREGNNFK